MRSFFKFFFAALLALIVFCILTFIVFAGIVGTAFSKSAPAIAQKSVLQIDLSTLFEERPSQDFRSVVERQSLQATPSFYDLLRLIHKAKSDDNISGIFLIANNNVNGFASSNEIRAALQDFRSTGKFIVAYADDMSQKAYSVANVANKIYVSPKGSFEWNGMSVNYMFLKGTLDKLEIKPQIFYAGKFKSATEPLRTEQMTDANKLQTTVWLNDIYNNFLLTTSEARKVDTTTLHKMANAGLIETPQDAVTAKLIDGIKYDDELKNEIKSLLKIDEETKINFLPVEKYATANSDLNGSGDKIALIYASGDIVNGQGNDENIGSLKYVDLIRKARLDKDIKAIVVRVNSGGGSALASENIWREMSLAKKVKPLMVSFGNVAASGGYYMSVAADSIFASKNTITGSIGVFGVVPNMSDFFKNKLGVTFDGVATGPLANAGHMDHAMNDREKKLVQNSIERIYTDFKQRVSDGRKKDTAYVETIAQGRVWTGIKAKDIGLVDAFGGLEAAINAAAKKANLSSYSVKEIPAPENWFEKLLGSNNTTAPDSKIKKELGIEYYNIYKQLYRIRELSNGAQARIPFDFEIN